MLIGPRKISRIDSTPKSLFFGGSKGGWWDFSDVSTLYSDAAGTQISDGTGIYTVMDKSGNGNTLTQATSGNRPAWNKAGYADFVSASSRYLFRTDDMGISPGGELSPEWSIFVWLAAPTIGTSQYCCSFGQNVDTDPAIALSSNPTTASTLSMFIRDDSGVNSHALTVALQTNSFVSAGQMVGVTVGGPETGARVQPWLNTTRGTVAALSNYSGVHTLNRFTLGALVRSTVTNYLNAAMYQALVINRALRQDEVTALYGDWIKRVAQ